MDEIFKDEILSVPDGIGRFKTYPYRKHVRNVFTDEERRKIYVELKNYSRKARINFIEAIEPICCQKYELINYNNHHEAKDNLISFTRKINKIYDEFEAVIWGDKNLIPHSDMTDTDIESQSLEQAIIVSSQFIQNELELIMINADKLNDLKSKSGRVTANHDGFYTQIAELYSIHIDKPSTTRDTTFMNLIRIINEAIGKSGELTPERAVIQAIQEMKAKKKTTKPP